MGHWHLLTTHPELQRKLFIDVLGGVPEKTGKTEWAMFPGVFVGFMKGNPAGGTVGSVINHIGFVVKDLDATRAKLVGAGVTIEREMPETRQFFATFPDHIRVEFSEDSTLDVPIRHHHIHFATDHLEGMRNWYAKIFGAVLGTRAVFKAADLPGANLSWNAAQKPPAPTKDRAFDHIGFEVKNLDKFCAKLKAQGVTFDTPSNRSSELGLSVATLTDPWGTRIELTEGLANVK